MDNSIISIVLSILNSPAVMLAIGLGALWVYRKVIEAKPELAKYSGYIISAIKEAEKAIPDTTENKGLARLDKALQYVLEVYKTTTGNEASAELAAEIKNEIQVVHADLEANGNL